MNDRKYYQLDPEHVKKLLDVFDATGTAVFFKGNIKPDHYRPGPALARGLPDDLPRRDADPAACAARKWQSSMVGR